MGEDNLIRDLKQILKAGKHMQSLPRTAVADLPQVARFIEAHLQQLPVQGKIVQDSLILEFLYGCIRQQLAQQRRHYLLPEPGEDSLRKTALRELSGDFQQEDADLESWSVLFHYYVRHDLNLSWDVLADQVGLEERTLRRRADSGVYWLTRQLIREVVQLEKIPD